jgi:anaerobic sulfite reductase subunit A
MLSDFTPEFVSADPQPVTIPDPTQLQTAIRERDFFNHPLWKDYAQRCIACGRCNTHCVTCSCFSSFDIADDEHPQAGERRRVWAGCHIDRFTDMAGGHQFREDNGSRMRFKTLHKIYDFYLRFGSHMCVGCGRCDAHCPEYISFADCITRVSRALAEGQ